MKFAIALFTPPEHPATRRALRFAEAVLSEQHQIVQLFFYQSGVHNASGNITPPQDEANLALEWQQFIRCHQLEAVVCVAAALRRGILDDQEVTRHVRQAANLTPEMALSGLGQLHMAAQQADRLICFGGPS